MKTIERDVGIGPVGITPAGRKIMAAAVSIYQGAERLFSVDEYKMDPFRPYCRPDHISLLNNPSSKWRPTPNLVCDIRYAGRMMERRPEPELMDLPEEAEAYASANFADVNDAFVQRLVELADERTEARVLDLGCGPGDIAVRLARRRLEWRIVSADASQAMLDLARQALRKAGMNSCVELIRADAKRMPFAEHTFDVLACSSLLHHIPDPVDLWREIKRLVRPGGVILLRDLHRPDSAEAASAIVEQYAGGESMLLREEFHRSLLAAFTEGEVREQLKQAGLMTLTVKKITDRHLDAFGTVS